MLIQCLNETILREPEKGIYYEIEKALDDRE